MLLLKPTDGPYDANGQGVHTEAPVEGAKLPAAHRAALLKAGVGQKDPRGHIVPTDMLEVGQKAPMEQLLHEVTFPVDSCPGRHAMGFRMVLAQKEPGGQSEQVA